MPTPDKHGDPVVIDHPDPDGLPSWYVDDPDLWYGLTTSMTEWLALERMKGSDDD